MKSAPDLTAKNFTAMLRLDHNRALSQLADKTGTPVADIDKLVVWGNHSPTHVSGLPLRHRRTASRCKDAIDDAEWNAQHVHPDRAASAARRSSRRAALSSAASAANAAIDHIHDWVLGSDGKWVTMGVPSDGSYGIPEGVIYGVPVTTRQRRIHAHRPDLPIDDFSRKAMDKTLAELEEERAGVAHLL